MLWSGRRTPLSELSVVRLALVARVAAFVAVFVLCVPSVDPAAILVAQDCTTFVPPCPNDEAPAIMVTPVSGSVFTGADSIIEITVFLYDDHALNVSGYNPQLSGMTLLSTISGEWVYPGPQTGTFVYRVRLASGSGNNITVAICDHSTPPPAPKRAPATPTIRPRRRRSKRRRPFRSPRTTMTTRTRACSTCRYRMPRRAT